jgi:hypothetical protein
MRVGVSKSTYFFQSGPDHDGISERVSGAEGHEVCNDGAIGFDDAVAWLAHAMSVFDAGFACKPFRG